MSAPKRFAPRCPHCDSSDLVARKLKSGFRCRRCKEIFTRPNVNSRAVVSAGARAARIEIGRGSVW
jgi:transposase-like protein